MPKQAKKKVATRWSKKGRMLTVYFETEEEKNTFDEIAKTFGISSSTMGTLFIRAGIRDLIRNVEGGTEMVIKSERIGNVAPKWMTKRAISLKSLLGRFEGFFVGRR